MIELEKYNGKFMKRFSLTLLLLFGISYNCFAQPEHRIAIGFGALSHGYNYALSKMLVDVEDCQRPPLDINDTDERTEEHVLILPVNLNFHYEYTLGKHLGLGLCLGYDRLRMNQMSWSYVAVVDVDPNGNEYLDWNRTSDDNGYLHRHIFFVMPEIAFYWFKKERCAMYSKFAAGVRFNFEKREFFNSSRPNITEFKEHHIYFHGAPICFEVGRNNLRFFGELGYGAQGVGQIGVKYTFDKKESGTE